MSSISDSFLAVFTPFFKKKIKNVGLFLLWRSLRRDPTLIWLRAWTRSKLLLPGWRQTPGVLILVRVYFGVRENPDIMARRKRWTRIQRFFVMFGIFFFFLLTQEKANISTAKDQRVEGLEAAAFSTQHYIWSSVQNSWGAEVSMLLCRTVHSKPSCSPRTFHPEINEWNSSHVSVIWYEQLSM